MAGLPPGDPQLVSMIVNHLKTQGLFDQFRRDCLADVDTKPAYLNLRQRVDNFVSNHLSNHTWSPHLNKNQLRNNIRQLVLQSGMLEQGVDRIVAQVVDPKIHHIFRPQVEKVVRQFLSPGSHVDEPSVYYSPGEERQDLSLPQSVVGSAPGTSANAMSILDTISSLNQEASSRTDGERYQKGDLVAEEAVLRAAEEAALKDMEETVLNGSAGEQDMSLVEEEEEGEAVEKLPEEDEKTAMDVSSSEMKTEDMSEEMDIDRESEDMKAEEEEKENQVGEEREVKEEEGKDKSMSQSPAKAAEETPSKDQETSKINEKQRIRQKARERLKEEYSLEDSDLEGLSDITVSSVHTSDLSSFEGESDDEPQPSDSTEEGEITSEDEKTEKKKAGTEDGEENKERKPGARRQGYVHKPFLYSRYYSDSDDEVTVEQRRRSAAKDKEERLLKRQQNRERLEEKRRTKQSQVEEQDEKKAADDTQRPRAKEACKEKKVLEKKVALSRKRKRDSRKEGDIGNKKKGDAEGDDMKKDESQKVGVSKSLASKSQRKFSESLVPDDAHRRKSGSISEEPSEPRKLVDKNRTHSFILDLEQGSEELLRQRSSGKFDRHSRKDQHLKERKEKERDRSVSDESAKLKQKSEKKAEMHGDESSQKEGAEAKLAAEDKGEKKSSKLKMEKKTSSVGREVRPQVSEGSTAEEGHRDSGPKKTKASMTEAPKEKERTKGDKVTGKMDPRQSLAHPDSTGSSEERSDLEQGSEGIRKKEKLIKEVLKRSKSVTEVKHAEKHRSRHDSKDSDKDKVKGAYGSPERPPLSKSISESDGEPRRSRDVEPGSKGKTLEKSRSKSREDPKSPVLFKPDKKVSTQDTKSKSTALVSKADLTKEKRREGSSKEEKKPSEEHSSDKSQDTKGTKKPSERKAKDAEKKGEAQSERKGSKVVDASLGSPISPTTPETPISGRASQLKESSMEAEPTVTADTNTGVSAVTVSDDAFDALSDITPEPEGEDVATRLSECEEEVQKEKEKSRPLPAEAAALLSLMEVCSSAERNVVMEQEPRQEVTPCAELSLQEADMKMKEAALTLLSMDPDMTLSPSLIDSHMAPVATEAVTPPEEAVTPSVEPASEESVVDTFGSVQGAECVQPSKEMPADQHIPGEDVSDSVAAPVEAPVVTQEEVVLKGAVEEHREEENSANVEPTSITSPLQAMEVDTLVDQNDQNSEASSADVKPDESKSRGGRRRASSQTLASPSETGSASTVSEVPEVTEVSQPHSTETENENEGPSSGEIPDKSTVPETEEDQTKGDAGKQEETLQETSVTPNEALQEQNVPEAEDKPGIVEVMKGTRRGRQARLVKQSSSASQSDGQDEERGSDVSEMDEKSEGRVTRRGRRSAAAAAKDSSGKPKAEKEASSDQSSEPQVEETDAAKATESEAPRRGRSSKAAALSPESQQEEQTAEEGQKEPEKVEEPVGRRGRRLGVQPKDATTGRVGLKRKRSEETEDSGEEVSAEETKNSAGTEPSSGQPSQESTGASNQSEEQQDEGKQGSSAEMKSDHGEEPGDKPQKKTPRRGRPSKAAAAAGTTSTDDTDKASPEKKAKKGEEQESEQTEDQEQQEEEEEEDGAGGGEEEKEAKPRATRSAARLEAEKNKPSKPSTRALSKVKEDSTPNTRGAKGQTTTAAKGGRKREASPSAPRTRGGQKSEETPAKRTKR